MIVPSLIDWRSWVNAPDAGEPVIVEGDALEWLRANPGRFQLIVTSPPYNAGMDYGPEVNDEKA